MDANQHKPRAAGACAASCRVGVRERTASLAVRLHRGAERADRNRVFFDNMAFAASFRAKRVPCARWGPAMCGPGLSAAHCPPLSSRAGELARPSATSDLKPAKSGRAVACRPPDGPTLCNLVADGAPTLDGAMPSSQSRRMRRRVTICQQKIKQYLCQEGFTSANQV